MKNQLEKKLIDILGPISDDKLAFGNQNVEAVSNSNIGGYIIHAVTNEQRIQIEQALKDELKLKEVRWIDYPTAVDTSGNVISAESIKLTNTIVDTYDGKIGYLYQIMFTPKLYNPSDLIFDTVKDGCTIGPIIYNTETFEPSRVLIMTWNPSRPAFTDDVEMVKQQLRDQLDMILENPEEYTHPGFRACMIRIAIV
jgi:hypothetical protein